MPASLLLDVGEHPVSNCYVRSGERAPTKRLLLGKCDHCALLHLCRPFSEADLFRFVPKWVRYREPEEHLDEVAAMLCEHLGDKSAQVAGLTYIDTPLLDRLSRRGYTTCSLDLLNEGAPAEHCGIETMLHEVQQDRWTSGGTKFDLVIARHVLDHSRDFQSFFAFIAASLSSEGVVMFEVPDSTTFFEPVDYLMLWESHANYFTPTTFDRLLSLNGFDVKLSQRFTADGATVLVAVCTRSPAPTLPPDSATLDDSDGLKIRRYIRRFAQTRDAYLLRFQEIRSTHRVVALFGAGHLGSLFVNIFGLGEFIDFAVDDDPNKSGLALPGSNLEIVSTEAIYQRDVRFVLLAASLASEERLEHRLKEKSPALNVASIHAQSPRSLITPGQEAVGC